MAKVGALISVRYEACEDLTCRVMSFTWVPIPSIFTTPFISIRNQSSSEGAMALLSRFEISRPELVEADEKVALLFEKIGWGQFFKCFSGHNVEVTKQFALSFKENVAQIGDFKFERWFKGGKVNKKKFQSLLLPLLASAREIST